MKKMLKEFRKTLVKVLHLRSIIGYNSLVFALKKTPLIGKILPDRLYSTTFLKVIYWIFHVIREVFSLFFTKMAGLGSVYVASLIVVTLYYSVELMGDMTKQYAFGMFALLFFLVYAFFGVVLNTKIFDKTTEKDYLVFMIRMNARKLNITLFAYDLGRLFIGYLLTGLIPAIFGVPVWCWLGIPFLAVFIKLFAGGFLAFRYKLKSRRHKPLKGTAAGDALKVVLICVPLPVLFIMVVGGYYVPVIYLFIISAVLILAGVWGLFELLSCSPVLHRKALHDGAIIEKETVRAEKERVRSFKSIKANGTVKGNKKGFEYLNALFVKRHFKMLAVKPIVCTIVILALTAFIIAEFVYGYYVRAGSDACINMVMTNLRNLVLFRGFEDPLKPGELDSDFLFFRYAVQSHLLALFIPISICDNTYKSTQAMYINCDNSLMTFSFFKQPKMIIRLFDVRLKQLISINILPAMAMAIGCNLILFATGGQDYPFQYLINFVAIACMSISFSMYWLSVYYLFQPYTTTASVKGGAYNVAFMAFGFLMSIIAWISVHSLILAAIMLAFTASFVFFIRKLVLKKAPKTWRVKA